MSFAVFMVTFLLRLWQKSLISEQQIVPTITMAGITIWVGRIMVSTTNKCAGVRVLTSNLYFY